MSGLSRRHNSSIKPFATVLRGLMGLAPNSQLHTAHVLRLSLDLPIVIEIVDTREKMARCRSRLQ